MRICGDVLKVVSRAEVKIQCWWQCEAVAVELKVREKKNTTVLVASGVEEMSMCM